MILGSFGSFLGGNSIFSVSPTQIHTQPCEGPFKVILSRFEQPSLGIQVENSLTPFPGDIPYIWFTFSLLLAAPSCGQRGDLAPTGIGVGARSALPYRVLVVFPPPQRVGVDVLRDAVQVVLVPNYMFVIIPLPEFCKGIFGFGSFPWWIDI
jgi:hypothetical protein